MHLAVRGSMWPAQGLVRRAEPDGGASREAGLGYWTLRLAQGYPGDTHRTPPLGRRSGVFQVKPPTPSLAKPWCLPSPEASTRPGGCPEPHDLT